MSDVAYNLTPEEESRLIDNQFRSLLDGYLASPHRRKVEIIERAYRFARQAHQGVRRRSGEPYIMHPLAVAQIVSREMGLGSTSICAALLHDVVEDTEYTVDDIEAQFGPKIAELVDGLTKISGGIFGDKASVQAENFRKLLLTMSRDIRVVLIKMADRLHNMRTLGSMAPAKQFKIAGETLYIYAPLAHRLGLYGIKTELEDLSFKYEHPAEYERISQLLEKGYERRAEIYAGFATPIRERLDAMGLKYEAKDRLKSIYSIWRKMETKHIPFEEVYDLYAMRIIFDCPEGVSEKELCYKIYVSLTELYTPHPERTRDWISVPKANGYQALHVTLMGPEGNWIEVQIRSRRMDDIAEKGFAAHWKYKIGGTKEEESELTVWLKTIKDILDDPTPSAIDFLDTLKLNLFSSEIVVFTPQGELLTLPADATVLDAAYSLHSELGNHCIAGKVNHKLVPLSHRLASGDQFEVLTSQNQHPKQEWLQILTTAKARTRLRKELRREMQPAIEKGRQIFDKFLADNSITLSNEVLTSILGRYHVSSRDDLFYKLGTGEAAIDDYLDGERSASNRTFMKRLLSLGKFGKKKGDDNPEGQETRIISDPTGDIVITKPAKINTKETYRLTYKDGTRNFMLPECCHVLPGDDVMGFIRDDGFVEIHALTCPRAQLLKSSYGSRIVAVEWPEDPDVRFMAEIVVEGIDRRGILQELTLVISSALELDMRRLNIEAHDEVFTCRLTVRVASTNQVNQLLKKIKNIDGVKRANRIKT
ncbi:MAG: RelA/SpoT family protein [Duncaniella sp.]|nr:RelA/SpoT family protein [Duncaniella sp.]